MAKAILKFHLILLMALGPLLQSVSALAQGRERMHSPLAVKYRLNPQSGPVRPYEMSFSKYEALGLETAKGFESHTRQIHRAFNQQNLKFFDPGVRNYHQSPELLNLKDRDVPEMWRQARAAKILAMEATGYGSETARRILSAENRILAELAARSKVSTQNLPQNHLLRQRAQILSIAEVLGEMKSPQLFTQIRQIRADALRTLANPNLKSVYDFQLNKDARLPRYVSPWEAGRVKNGEVKVMIRQNGRMRPVWITDPAVEVEQVKFSSKMAQLKQATISIGTSSLILSGLMMGAGLARLEMKYNEDPDAFEDMLEELITPVYFLSFAAFVFAGEGYNAVRYSMVQKNIDNLYRIATAKNAQPGKALFANKAQRSALIRQNMAGISLGRTSLGILASVGVQFLGGRYLACFDLLNDTKGMSAAQRIEKEEICDMSFVEFALNVWPQTATAILSLVAAQKMLFLLGPWTGSLFKGMKNVYTMSTSRFQSVVGNLRGKGVSHAARNQILKSATQGVPAGVARAANAGRIARLTFVRSLGMMTFTYAGFVILFDVGHQAINWAWEHMKLGGDLNRQKGSVQGQFKDFIENGFAYPDRELCFGQLVSDEEMISGEGCTLALDQSLNQYYEANNKWRALIQSPLLTRYNNWIEYFSKATNMYDATRLFYEDVLNQVNERRRRAAGSDGAPFVLEQDSESGLAPDNYVRYMYEDLPLFRSHPLFGVREEHMDSAWLNPDLTLRDWSRGMTSSERQEIYLSLEAKMSLTREVGDWLLEQSQREDVDLEMRNHFYEVGLLLAPRKSDTNRILTDQLLGLLELDRFSYANNHLICRIQSQIDDPYCVFYRAQAKLSDIVPVAVEYLRANLEDGVVLEQDRDVVIELIALLGSEVYLDRVNGVEKLIDINYNKSHDRVCANSEQLQTPACIFAATLNILDPNLVNNHYSRFAKEEAQRILRFAPFNYRYSPDKGGYLRKANQNSSGPLPLAPGHKYFMNFFNTFASAGIDFDWHPKNFAGQSVQSMAHYLMLSMVCGPEIFSRNDSVITDLLGYKPEFHPPRWHYAQDFDFCSGVKRDPFAIYHEITYKRGQRPYAGLVDLLYRNADLTFGGQGFEAWWERWMQTPLENLIIRGTHEALDERRVLGIKTTDSVVDLTDKVLTGGDGWWDNFTQNRDRLVSLGHGKNILSSVEGEIEFYFDKIFEPIYNDPLVEWVDSSLWSVQYDENGEPTDEIRFDYRDDEDFKKTYLKELRSQMMTGLRGFVENAQDDPDAASTHLLDLVESVHMMRQLFQAFTGDYRIQFETGEIGQFPRRSFRNLPTNEFGDETQLTEVTRYVMDRIQYMVEVELFGVVYSQQLFQEQMEELAELQ